MAKDIIIDDKERDVLFMDVTDSKTVVYDTQWGRMLIEDADEDVLNVLVPIQYRKKVKFSDGELIVKLNIPYRPVMKPFRVRFFSYIGDELVRLDRANEPQGEYEVLCESDDVNIPETPNASQLPLINVDGYFTLRLADGSDKAYIYSGKESDLEIDNSDNQSAKILMLCAPGKLYRYPITGISIYDYLNGVIAHSDIAEKIKEQFDGEERNVIEAYFDSVTGHMDLTASPEITDEDENLDDIMALNLDELAEITGNDFSEITGHVSLVKYYVGSIDKGSKAFGELSVNELIGASSPVCINKNRVIGVKNINCTKQIFFILIPDDYTLTDFYCVSDNERNEIIKYNLLNRSHDNVIIKGVCYKIYAYFNYVTSPTNPLQYTFHAINNL